MNLLFSIQMCTYTLTVPCEYTMFNKNLSKGNTICINSTIFPFYVLFNEIPPDAVVSYYTKLSKYSDYSLYYKTLASNIGFALRPITINSSYVIHSTSAGTFSLAAVPGNNCTDGILISASANATYNFSNDAVDPFFQLQPGKNKCVLLSTTSDIYAIVDLDFSSNDFLIIPTTSGEEPRFTGKQTFQFHRPNNNNLFFFIMSVSQESISPSAVFVPSLVEGTQPNDGRQTIIFQYINQSDENEPTIQVQNVYKLSLWIVIVLTIVVSICVFMFLVLSIKFEWCKICFDFSCRKNESRSSSTAPMPPSAFTIYS